MFLSIALWAVLSWICFVKKVLIWYIHGSLHSEYIWHTCCPLNTRWKGCDTSVDHYALNEIDLTYSLVIPSSFIWWPFLRIFSEKQTSASRSVTKLQETPFQRDEQMSTKLQETPFQRDQEMSTKLQETSFQRDEQMSTKLQETPFQRDQEMSTKLQETSFQRDEQMSTKLQETPFQRDQEMSTKLQETSFQRDEQMSTKLQETPFQRDETDVSRSFAAAPKHVFLRCSFVC